MKRIKIIYNGKMNTKLDKEITGAIESIGGKWYAQGYDFTKDERDICFDITV